MPALPSLLVGLGNPGREYAHTRHNVGFMTIDELCERAGGCALRKKFAGQFGKLEIKDREVSVLKPETYMNESGRSVQPAAAFFHIPTPEILVVHDELDLPFGEVRLKVGGGHAGHNGLRSLVECLGSSDFARLRIGIGRPPATFQGDTADFVLSSFSPGERQEVEAVVAKAVKAIHRVLSVGVERAMNELNVRPRPGRTKPAGSTPGGSGPPRGDSGGPSGADGAGGTSASGASGAETRPIKTSAPHGPAAENGNRAAWRGTAPRSEADVLGAARPRGEWNGSNSCGAQAPA